MDQHMSRLQQSPGHILTSISSFTNSRIYPCLVTLGPLSVYDDCTRILTGTLASAAAVLVRVASCLVAAHAPCCSLLRSVILP